jgi:peptide/bleomycin uptake transporter
MFSSFFPNPRLFFSAALIWTALSMVLWYGVARDLGPTLSLGGLVGFPYPPGDAPTAAATVAAQTARDIWLYEYMIVVGAVFCALVAVLLPHRWSRWSVWGSALIIFLLWFQVQIDVMINNWFGTFYNMLQQALAKPNSVTLEAFFGQLWTFGGIALVGIFSAVLSAFFTSHYVFRWRAAMNEFYVAHWPRLRHIEGASQRVQDDTARFSSTVEGLGASLVSALMTLIAFLPILWGLSSYVKELPLVGPLPQALVFVAILWAAVGTTALALSGIRLPGLEFRNQRVEAAYRKELVLGEDDGARAEPPTLRGLFADVRTNYFRLYIALAPTIVAGGMTLGVLTQTTRAFGRVEESFQYLVRSWTTIVSLISVYKRLRAFEATLRDEPLAPIEQEPIAQPS